VLRNLRNRASHVDIDDVGAQSFNDLRRIGHLFWVAAKNLNRYGALLLGVLSVFERPINPAYEPFRAHHLGDDKPASAMTLHEAPEGGVRHAGHRRDDEWRFQYLRADL
jgi:hypothetical protein